MSVLMITQLQRMKVATIPATVLAVACGCSAVLTSILTMSASPRTAPVCLVAGCLSVIPVLASAIPTSAATALPVMAAGCLCRPARVLTSMAATALRITTPLLAVTHGSSLASASASI